MLKLFLILLTSLGMELANQGAPAIREMQRNAPAQLTGVVTGPDGNPVEGAEVLMMPNHYTKEIKTDAEGKYSIDWRPSNFGWVDGNIYVLAKKEDDNLAGSIAITLDAKKADIKMSTGYSAKGKVIDESGGPLEGASVGLTFWSDSWGTSMERGESKIKTDSNGEYVINCLPVDNRFSINIRNLEGYGSGSQEFRTDPGVNNAVAVEKIVLQVADQKISGKVVDEDGKGLVSVNLSIYGSGQPNKNIKSDKDGNFIFENVCAGRASIQANYQKDNRYLYSNVQTEGGAENVLIVIGGDSNSNRFVPRQPASLIGKAMPDMTKYGIDNLDFDGKVVLFFWDMRQRPSRHFIKQFAAKKDLLESKNIDVVMIHNGIIDQDKLNGWLSDNGVTLESIIMSKELDDARYTLGLKGLPWMFMVNEDNVVVAEGFTVEELEGMLK